MYRGVYIKQEKWKKAKAIEEKIRDKLREDEDFVDKL